MRQIANQIKLPSLVRSIYSRLMHQTPLRWWVPNRVTRREAIQRSINMLNANRYLEIGVDSGECFAAIDAPLKIGVDPIDAQPLVVTQLNKPGVKYFALTSDDFFAQEAGVLSEGVDVVFIDGLHTFDQAYRDVKNSLKYLNAGGVILLHDCLPASEIVGTPANSYDEAAILLSGQDWDGCWTGDPWKAIVILRATHPELNSCVLNSDNGIGLVYKGFNDSGLTLSSDSIAGLTYTDLMAAPQSLLGLRKPAHLLKILAKLGRQQG